MNRNPKSAATSDFILIVMIFIGYFKIYKRSSPKSEEFSFITFTVHMVYIVSNFISFIDNVITLYSLKPLCLFFMTT